jgi:putative ABC transport system permease protein
VLLALAVLVVVVAGIGILVSIYNSMSDRRHEIAVIRALGARRKTVMAIILLESILLSLGGGAVGLILGHGLIGAFAPLIMEHTGVAVGALQFQPIELVLIPGLIVLASIVGYLPAVVAYRTDVAESLSARP